MYPPFTPETLTVAKLFMRALVRSEAPSSITRSRRRCKAYLLLELWPLKKAMVVRLKASKANFHFRHRKLNTHLIVQSTRW